MNGFKDKKKPTKAQLKKKLENDITTVIRGILIDYNKEHKRVILYRIFVILETLALGVAVWYTLIK